jgi:predicted RNA-binding protein associated with RNAse of E/G family
VVLPPRKAVVLDADELEAARVAGTVSDAEYDLAWCEARMLLRLIAEGALPILELTEGHLRDYFGV